MKRIALPNGADVPALGQGTWRIGERAGERAAEIAALQLGLDLGLTLIDTAEMYAEGGAEQVVAEAIAGRRDEVFVVSKAYPRNAGRRSLPEACERSLRRLRTDRIDLYLLHWRGSIRLAETVEAFTALRQAGKIRAWGVSNFDVADMEELHRVLGGPTCATNQVLYNPASRGIEFDLLPWCAGHRLPVMAYTPLGQHGQVLGSKALAEVARRHAATPAQIVLAWSIRSGRVICIPKSTDPVHVRANAAAADIVLTPEDIAAIDRAFPPPRGKQALDMV